MDETHVGSLSDLQDNNSLLPVGMRITLMGKKGPVEGQKFSVEKILTAIGRSSGDIVINQPTLSGRHAEIEVVEKDVFVSDLKSTNGTFVNGEKIDRALIKNLDSLKLGDLEFNVLILEDRYMEQEPGDVENDLEEDEELTELIAEEEISQTRRLGSSPQISPSPLKDHCLYLGLVIGGKKRVYKVETESVVIGSGDAQVLIGDDSVSGRHLQIEILNEIEIRVKDLASTNGTLLNGKPISVEYVHNGDLLKLGESFVKILLRPRK